MLINVNSPIRVRELVAVSLAITLHSLAFLYLEFPMLRNVSNVKQALYLNVEIESNSAALADVIKGSSSPPRSKPEISKSSSPPDQAVKRKSRELTRPDVMSALDNSKEKNEIDVAEPLSLQSFNQWLSNEASQFSSKNSPALDRFKNSFDAPVIENKPDIRYADSVPSPLGGGLYKIRRDGVTCEQITMVPMTMDDQLYGTLEIIGNCVKEEKIKIKLGKSKELNLGLH